MTLSSGLSGYMYMQHVYSTPARNSTQDSITRSRAPIPLYFLHCSALAGNTRASPSSTGLAWPKMASCKTSKALA